MMMDYRVNGLYTRESNYLAGKYFTGAMYAILIDLSSTTRCQTIA